MHQQTDIIFRAMKVPEEHCLILEKALKSDIEENLEEQNIKAIVKDMEIQRQKIQEESRKEQEDIRTSHEEHYRLEENILMENEDATSKELRFSHRKNPAMWTDFGKNTGNPNYERDLNIVRMIDWEHQNRDFEEKRFFKNKDPTGVCQALQLLLKRIQRLVHSSGSYTYLPGQDKSQGDSKQIHTKEVSNDDSITCNSVTSLCNETDIDNDVDNELFSAEETSVSNSLISKDGSVAEFSTTSDSVKRRLRLKNNKDEQTFNKLVHYYALTVAAIHTLLDIDIIKNGAKLVSAGVVKLLHLLLSNTYYMSYTTTLDSNDLTMNENNVNTNRTTISLPNASMNAIKRLCKPSFHQYTVNHKNIRLFASLDGIRLCMDIIQYHMRDHTIIESTLELLLVFLDSELNEERTFQALVTLTNDYNVTILIMIIERYTNQVRIRLFILTIFSLMYRKREFRALVAKCTAFVLQPKLCNFVVLAAKEGKNEWDEYSKLAPIYTDKEHILFLCKMICNVYFDLDMIIHPYKTNSSNFSEINLVNLKENKTYLEDKEKKMEDTKDDYSEHGIALYGKASRHPKSDLQIMKVLRRALMYYSRPEDGLDENFPMVDSSKNLTDEVKDYDQDVNSLTIQGIFAAISNLVYDSRRCKLYGLNKEIHLMTLDITRSRLRQLLDDSQGSVYLQYCEDLFNSYSQYSIDETEKGVMPISTAASIDTHSHFTIDKLRAKFTDSSYDHNIISVVDSMTGAVLLLSNFVLVSYDDYLKINSIDTKPQYES